MGTDNKALLDDPFYLGLRQPRQTIAENEAFVDELVHSVRDVFPKVKLQFEDWTSEAAFHYLERYRHEHRVWNDDIQGTGAVILSGSPRVAFSSAFSPSPPCFGCLSFRWFHQRRHSSRQGFRQAYLGAEDRLPWGRVSGRRSRSAAHVVLHSKRTHTRGGEGEVLARRYQGEFVQSLETLPEALQERSPLTPTSTRSPLPNLTNAFFPILLQGLITADRGDKLAKHKEFFVRKDNGGKQYKDLEDVVDYVSRQSRSSSLKHRNSQ